MTKTIRLIVLGSRGQLGRSIIAARPRHTHFVVTPYHREILDYTHPEVLETSILDWHKEQDNYTSTLIVNCAAFTQVDRAQDPQLYPEVYRLNVTLPKLLSMTGFPIIHIGSDYVFDGKSHTPYDEESPTAPCSIYGSTKLQGEIELLTHTPKGQHLTLRTQWLYAPWGNNFIRTILRIASHGQPLRIIDDQIGAPTSALSLAEAIYEVAEQYTDRGDFPTHLLHYSDSGSCSWYELARQAIKVYLPDYPISELLTPISSEEYPTAAQRPRYSVLSNELFTSIYKLRPPHWTESLHECLDQMTPL